MAAEQNRTGALEDPWAYELEAREQGCRCIAGVDEAGRGPLAGPVVAAAVVLPQTFEITGINDSKKLTKAHREAAYQRILKESIDVGVGIVDADVIDEINILEATHLAARNAILGLRNKVDVALVDGRPMTGLPCPQRAIIKGDSKCVSIAAASIVAKVTRDRIMTDYDRKYPEYGFCRHKGYYTQEHLQALDQHGVCEIHRRTFFPICQKVSMTCQLPGLEED